MTIDINASPITVKGIPYTKSFARTPEEKAEQETYANVLLNCLAGFPVRQKSEIFLVNHIAEKILSAKDGQLEISDMERDFLGEVLVESTFQTDKKKEMKGVYMAHLIAQALRQIGITQF